MLEKLENKINEEIDKVLEKKDYTLNEIKTLIEIKTSLEMKDFLKNSMTLSNSVNLDNNVTCSCCENLEKEEGDVSDDSDNNK